MTFSLQDPLLVVDVLAEEVQRGDALDEPALDRVPFVGRDDAGNEVEREDLLDAGRVACKR